MLDLRSDTATKPTPAMREAIANAEVGDEQLREDPTVNELERRAADTLGQDDAVFVPTATMANEIALRVLGDPGDELIAEENAHLAAAALPRLTRAVDVPAAVHPHVGAEGQAA